MMEFKIIEECCTILDSQRIPITAKNRIAGCYPYYGANGVQDYVSDYIFDDELVLLAEDGGNFGSKSRPIAYRVSGKCWVNNHAHVLKPKENLNVDYLCYSLMFYDTNNLVNGATRKKLTQSTMRQMKIPYLNIKDQLKIVKKLKKIEEMMQNYRNQINLLDELVKARFVELFGDIISNDKNWNSKPLKELCDISRGASPRPISDYLGGTIPWIKIGDATIGDSIYINSTKEHIIKEGVRKSRFIKKGSLIFANCGVSLGFCRIINFDGCIHDGWLAFQNIDTSLNKIFLLTTINQMTGYFRKIAPGGTQPNLNTDIVGNYIQVVPPIELQNQFADFVKEVDKSRFIIKSMIKEGLL